MGGKGKGSIPLFALLHGITCFSGSGDIGFGLSQFGISCHICALPGRLEASLAQLSGPACPPLGLDDEAAQQAQLLGDLQREQERLQVCVTLMCRCGGRKAGGTEGGLG